MGALRNGENFAFSPPNNEDPPGSAHSDLGKGDKGQSDPITNQTLELGMQKHVRPRPAVLRWSAQELPQRKRPVEGQAG